MGDKLKEDAPISVVVVAVAREHVLQGAILILGLAVRLGVIRRRLDVVLLEQVVHCLGNAVAEFTTSVRDISRHSTVAAIDVGHDGVGHFNSAFAR